MKTKKYILFLFMIAMVLVNYGCLNKTKDSVTKLDLVVNEDISIYDYEGLEPLLQTDSEKTHIVNFWAMWCAPCVKELPIIEAYRKNNPDTEILLVSLDFTENIETELKPFLKEKGITSKVVLLDDPDSNTWINKIDPNWSGAIPFTIVFNNKKRVFYERSFESLEDLETEIQNNFNNK